MFVTLIQGLDTILLNFSKSCDTMKILAPNVILIISCYKLCCTSNITCLSSILNQLHGTCVLIDIDPKFIAPSKPCYVYNSQGISERKLNTNAATYLIGVKNVSHIHDIFDAIKLIGRSCKSLYVVQVYRKEDVESIFETLWRNRIHRVIITLGDESYTIDFDKFSCRNIITTVRGCVDIPTFDFKNCEVKAFWHYKPPVVIDVQAARNPGIGISIIKTVARKYKLDLAFRELDDVTRKELVDYESFRNVFRLFENGTADICVSALTDIAFLVDQDVDATTYILQTEMLVTFPNPSALSRWDRITHLLTPVEWVTIILIDVALVMLLTRLERNETITYVTMVIFGLNFNVPPSDGAIFSRNRLISTFIFFYFLIISAYLQGKLSSYYTIPEYEPPIEDFGELMASRYLFLVRNKMRAFLMTFGYDLRKMKNTKAVTGSSHEGFREFLRTRDHIREGQNMFEILFPQYKDSYRRIVIANVYMSFAIKRCFYLHEQIDRNLYLMHETGLLLKWMLDIEWSHRLAANFTYTKDNQIARLTIDDTSWGFSILGVGLLVATIVFILEIYVKKRD